MNTLIPAPPPQPVLLYLSHLRWDFVFPRPQYLMAWATAGCRVVVEKLLPATSGRLCLHTLMAPEGVLAARFTLPTGLDTAMPELPAPSGSS